MFKTPQIEAQECLSATPLGLERMGSKLLLMPAAAMTEKLLLFPTYGSWIPERNQFKINIKGWAFSTQDHRKTRILLKKLTRRILSPMDGGAAGKRTNFEDRTMGLVSTALVRKAVKVAYVGVASKNETAFSEVEYSDFSRAELRSKIAADNETYPSIDFVTDANGLFEGWMYLDKDQINASDCGEILSYSHRLQIFAYLNDTSEVTAFTVVTILEPEGISLVSDVDDTIKLSGVYQGLFAAAKIALLDDIKDVPGMADCYNLLYSKSVAFHYVSGGPYQIFPMVKEFIKTFKFPDGSLILRNTSELSTVEYKYRVIMDLIREFPRRKFILVGDSGEKDIEIYEKVRKEAPEHILKVFIRDVGNQQNPQILENRARSISDPGSVKLMNAKSAPSNEKAKQNVKPPTEELANVKLGPAKNSPSIDRSAPIVSVEEPALEAIAPKDGHFSWGLFSDPTAIITDDTIRKAVM